LEQEIFVSLESRCVEQMADPQDSFATLTARDAERIFREVLQCLTERQQLVILLRYNAEHTYAEIAQRVDTSEPSVRRVHARALATLRRELAVRSIFGTRDVL
jgi:RNA polymerase sigma factor (sigma-70 family)